MIIFLIPHKGPIEKVDEDVTFQSLIEQNFENINT